MSEGLGHALAGLVRAARLGWFAMVMATGIVSVALQRSGSGWPSAALLFVALGGFAVCTVANVLRAAVFPADLAAELANPGLAFTAFAVTAACVVLGDRLVAAGDHAFAAVLAGAALAWWLAMVSALPFTCSGRRRARLTPKDVNGTWYLCAVATQSLAIAVTFVHAGGLLPAGLAFWAGTGLWLLGAALYLSVSALVALRLQVAGLGQNEPTAPYWVAMGGAAITALAAAQLTRAGAGPATIGRATLAALALAFWLLAGCLIPVVAGRSCWRHIRGSVPLRYRADLWMVVFPAGMYSVASFQLGAVARSPLIRYIGVAAVWPATAAWALTFAAMALSLASGLRKPAGSSVS